MMTEMGLADVYRSIPCILRQRAQRKACMDNAPGRKILKQFVAEHIP